MSEHPDGTLVLIHDGIAQPLDGNWGPVALGYVERCELAAKLMALAEIVDPGDYETYTMNRKYLAEGD